MDGFGRLASTLLDRDADGEASLSARGRSSMALPNSGFGFIKYVRIYATCRLRRIWVSTESRGDGDNFPWEFGLYGK